MRGANERRKEHQCPLCQKDFPEEYRLFDHIRQKPGHFREMLNEMDSLRDELVYVKDAATAWRELAKSRATLQRS